MRFLIHQNSLDLRDMSKPEDIPSSPGRSLETLDVESLNSIHGNVTIKLKENVDRESVSNSQNDNRIVSSRRSSIQNEK